MGKTANSKLVGDLTVAQSILYSAYDRKGFLSIFQFNS